MDTNTLQFVKLGKEYNSTHGGKWFHIYFKDLKKSYRTALYCNMRNFKNWTEIINKAERGDYITNLKMKLYKGKEIVDADSLPKLITQHEMYQIECDIFEEHYGIPPH
jgi:hypothetical protein|tara:strand:+ start:607 stop:930 length:324 start_codon:yes stop_codon:yes gene_type:complete